MESDIGQSTYNMQHNELSHLAPKTSYQMLIEQVVTGNKSYRHMLFNEEDDPLESLLGYMDFRDMEGYMPELNRIGVEEEDYRISKDRISGPDYLLALVQPAIIHDDTHRREYCEDIVDILSYDNPEDRDKHEIIHTNNHPTFEELMRE